MTDSQRRARLLNALGLTVLLVGGWFAYGHFAQGRERFDGAVLQLQQATSMAQQIEILRQKPDQVAAKSQSDRALAESIEKATTSAGVKQNQIAHIEPQTPRRAGDTDYMEHSTLLQLDGVTLRELAGALAQLHQDGQGLDQLRSTRVRISAPYQSETIDEGDERWNVELTLTYFVYSPKTPVSRRS